MLRSNGKRLISIPEGLCHLLRTEGGNQFFTRRNTVESLDGRLSIADQELVVSAAYVQGMCPDCVQYLSEESMVRAEGVEPSQAF